MADKVKAVADVVRTIPDGSLIALGGFAVARNVITVVHELIRQQKKDLTLSQCVMGMDTDLLVGAGLVRRLIIGGGSLDRFGPVHCVNRARESGSVESHDYSSLTLCFRYLAGALGKPVFILVTNASDWRWNRNSQRSIWYDSARVIRQKKQDDWAPCIKTVRDQLKEMLGEQRRKAS